MYPYHNRIKQRIANGELIGIEQGTGEFAIVFIFSTYPFTRPIRSHALWRYADILNNQIKEKENGKFAISTSIWKAVKNHL